MGYLVAMAVGAAAGYFYPKMFDNTSDMLMAVVLGVVGAMIGSTILKLGLAALGFFANLIGAVVGALVAIWLYTRMTKTGN